MSGVRCQVSGVFFFLQSGGASQSRVCYQGGLPCLVYIHKTFYLIKIVLYVKSREYHVALKCRMLLWLVYTITGESRSHRSIYLSNIKVLGTRISVNPPLFSVYNAHSITLDSEQGGLERFG